MSEIDLMILPQTILQDLRYGARTLWRNAGFTPVAILALALGIGVNTTAFTFYKAAFGRSLDAWNPRTIVNLALMRQSGSTGIERRRSLQAGRRLSLLSHRNQAES
jgi:hypothetical protein